MARKVGIADDDVGGLEPRIVLIAVNDELTAEHAEVRVRLLAVGEIAIGKVGRIGLGVKGVTRGVNADEAEAVLDSIEKGLFALRGHRGIAVGGALSEITGGKEHDRVVSAPVLGIEDPAVLGRG